MVVINECANACATCSCTLTVFGFALVGLSLVRVVRAIYVSLPRDGTWVAQRLPHVWRVLDFLLFSTLRLSCEVLCACVESSSLFLCLSAIRVAFFAPQQWAHMVEKTIDKCVLCHDTQCIDCLPPMQ